MESENNSQNSILQRVAEVVNWLIFIRFAKNKRDLAAIMGYKESSFSQIINGKVPLSNKFIKNLAILDDRINIEWLLTGNGEMLRDASNPSHQVAACSLPVARQARADSSEGIPLIPVDAMAGALTDEQTILEYECERYVVPMFKGADFLIPVKGSSMYPKYSSGDIVACQRVHMSDLFFQWNKVYVIDTNQGALIKRIKPGSADDRVLIVSDNPKYDPFELPTSAIHAVALVIGVIRLE